MAQATALTLRGDAGKKTPPELTLSQSLLASCIACARGALEDTPHYSDADTWDAWFRYAAHEQDIMCVAPRRVFMYAMSLFCAAARRHPELVTQAHLDQLDAVQSTATVRQWWAPLMKDTLQSLRSMPRGAGGEDDAPAQDAAPPRLPSDTSDDKVVDTCVKLLELAVTRRILARDVAHAAPAVPFVWYDSPSPTPLPAGCVHAYIQGTTFAAPGGAQQMLPSVRHALYAALCYYNDGTTHPPPTSGKGAEQFMQRLRAFVSAFNDPESPVRAQCIAPRTVHMLNHLTRCVLV